MESDKGEEKDKGKEADKSKDKVKGEDKGKGEEKGKGSGSKKGEGKDLAEWGYAYVPISDEEGFAVQVNDDREQAWHVAAGRWTEIPISETDRAIANVMQLEERRISEELYVFWPK